MFLNKILSLWLKKKDILFQSTDSSKRFTVHIHPFTHMATEAIYQEQFRIQYLAQGQGELGGAGIRTICE